MLLGPQIDGFQLIIGHTFLDQGSENTLGASCLAGTVNDNTHVNSEVLNLTVNDLRWCGNWRRV